VSMEFCEHEDAVAIASRHGSLEGALLQHAEACPHCNELQLILRYLSQVPRSAEDVQPFGLIWWRAQLAERRDRAKRAVAVIKLMQKLAISITFAALFVFAWFWGREVSTVYLNTVFAGVGMFLATAAVLYGWARGRI
jgi:hypothetical protein